ncbi:hypothetical protein FOXB_15505 [Fusarium oxysporum f. sp. conglutinans Fo5176]|uniref:BTB domain-containing protein n=1 Tax=Fusarium oxysporum (strain Fo5176) TaxID=660025 RepID=F9GA23_FUSOF|nr:hypothetical protein FOXB_15505 [Fusarium oxysporum f. sp. conglutinans Fo5176]
MRLDETTNHALQSALKKAETGLYSDLKITCGDKQYQVHKAIICPRSPFFGVACQNHFRESQSNIINLPEDDPEAVDSMIYYIYNGYYPKIDPGTHGEFTGGLQVKFLVLHAKVYALAEKYEVSGLKEMAQRCFQIISNCGGSCSKEFAQAYRGLRDVVVQALHDNPRALDEEHIRRAMRLQPDLLYDLVLYGRGKDRKKEKVRRPRPSWMDGTEAS